MLDPKKNRVERATAIISEFEKMRDLYTILNPTGDENIVRMVGQVHIIRRWKPAYKDEYGSTDVSLWLALCGDGWPPSHEVGIKDALRLHGREPQSEGVAKLIIKHLDELYSTGRWDDNGLSIDAVVPEILNTEDKWIRFIEAGGLIVIKQTL